MNWVKMKKEYFTALVSVIMMLIGIALTSSSGFYAFQIFDDFSVSLGLLFIAFFQVISISWVYGNDKFANDIEYMTGKRPYLFWMICWKYISPLAIFIIFVANCNKLVQNTPTYKTYVGCVQQLFDFSPLSPGVTGSIVDSTYPGWAQFIIFCFIALPMVPIIVYLVMNLVKNPQKWINGFKTKFTTLANYHPDPSRVDPSRRKSPEETEIAILKEEN